MAIIIMAPTSSKIANDVKKILHEIGTREPNKLKMPSAKAISVAAGIAQPCIAVGSS